MLQCDNVSIAVGDADGASLGAVKSGGAAASCNSVKGFSGCSVETGSGGTSGITDEREGSGAEASGASATGCSIIKEEVETGSGSRAGSTGSGRSGIGRSTLKELGTSLEKIGGSSGRTGSSERKSAVGCGKSESLIPVVSVIDSLASLNIGGKDDGNGSGSLNAIDGSGVDVMDGEAASESGRDSG